MTNPDSSVAKNFNYKARQSKLLNFRSDIEDLKENKNVDVIWIDFGK